RGVGRGARGAGPGHPGAGRGCRPPAPRGAGGGPGGHGYEGHEGSAPNGSEDFAPVERFLVEPPPGPLSFKAYDGKASFDGASEVAFRWSSTGASSEKWKAGDQVFSVQDLCGVEWRSPDGLDGHLRLVPRGGGSREIQPDQDPASLVFGRYGPVHESLPFAAAVLGAIRAKDRVPVPAAAPVAAGSTAHRDPGAVAERIRHLGELHQAGLVTDAEFSAKKAELLAEL
ncbi:DUF4429 domain-containing protein, partial [Streptomyces sp. NPDC058872]|uniref:DUF4429 domain-containing protein n=1 Tax=Streptomyces sp. NPDC058872 TaxID=3346661 RepID=UPI003674F5D1